MKMHECLIGRDESILPFVEKFLAETKDLSSICIFTWYDWGSFAEKHHQEQSEQLYEELLATYEKAISDITEQFGAPEYSGEGPRSATGLAPDINSSFIDFNSRAEAVCFWRLPQKIILLEQSSHDARSIVDITLTVIDIECARRGKPLHAEVNAHRIANRKKMQPITKLIAQYYGGWSILWFGVALLGNAVAVNGEYGISAHFVLSLTGLPLAPLSWFFHASGTALGVFIAGAIGLLQWCTVAELYARYTLRRR